MILELALPLYMTHFILPSVGNRRWYQYWVGIVDGEYLRRYWRRDSFTGSPVPHPKQRKKLKSVVLKLLTYFWWLAIGTFEWSRNFYWHSRAYCSCLCACSPLGKVNISCSSFCRYYRLLIQARCQLWLVLLPFWNCRYFSGHTKDLDGKVQFVAGTTSISDAIDGVIKIFTIAVSANSELSFV